jgi:SAM-dependent methyltransferase
MADPLEPPPSPALFFETMNAYQRTEALKAAIELGLFTAIGEGVQAVDRLGSHLGASGRGVRILCDYLVVIGFLTKRSGLYGLTPSSATFLDRRSPAYIGSAVEFLASPLLTRGFADVAELVRRGSMANSEGVVAPEHPVWVAFARAMAPLMTLPSQLVADLAGAGPGRKTKVLDIAAGHGLFGIAVARRDIGAEIVAVDWPGVLAVAAENAREAGVSDRHRLLPGSAFDVDYGDGYDLALITNFLHHFDAADCVRLLRKVHAALAGDGRAIAVEFVPDEDRVSPPIPASFSLMMLGTTPGGDAYTATDLGKMFQEAGFSSIEVRPLSPTLHHAVLARR